MIKEHVDLDVAQDTVRFHVPIATNPDVIVTLNGTRVTPWVDTLLVAALDSTRAVA